MEIKQYTKEDFLESLEPYEFLYQFSTDGFQMEQVGTKLSQMAQLLGVRNFKKLFAEYVKSQKVSKKLICINNVTQFDGQQLELDTGEWRADEYGVSIETQFGEQFACCHPILPVERLVNIDTGIEKLKIAYRKGRSWRTIISDKKTLASSNQIVNLADCGIAVNSENSKHLVKYLHDIESLNYDAIPERNSVSRLGWIDGEGFSPYCGSLEFDGDLNFKKSFESVQEKGDFDKWIEVAKAGRNKNITTKIVLAASFASVLVKPLGCLPFFVHLWGGTEVGKTVGLMLAASVWANPEVGKYIQSFNSTIVGRERMAAFFNNTPLILDELQVQKDKKTFDHDIYTLCEGAGKTRGNKTGGTDQTPTWSNCILSNGEMPITTANSGGGAVNRIIEIECKCALFDEPQEVCNIIRKNYGMAGKRFVEYLQQEGIMDEINIIYKDFYSQLADNDTTQKQAISAALILTADKTINKLFFKDKALTACDIQTYLQTKQSVSANERGYQYLCSWVSQNSNKFNDDSPDIYGKIVADHVYFVVNVFNKACDDGGYNSVALISHLKERGLIKHSYNRNTIVHRINNIPTCCVCLVVVDDTEKECPF